MLIHLLVERGQDECFVKLAGTSYKFKRNEYGHLVSDITDPDHLRWVNDPINTAFKQYSVPKPKPAVIYEEVAEDNLAPAVDEVAPVVEEKPLPVYPAKGSKRPVKGSKG